MKYNIYILPVLVLIASCARKAEADTENVPAENWDLLLTEEQLGRNGMTVQPPAVKEFMEEVVATGEVDVPPANRSLVSAVLGGFIRDTPLLVGDRIRKGQAVATLESTEYVSLQQEYMEKFAQLNYLREEFERQEQLLAENISSRKAFLKAESEYRGTLAQLTGLREKLGILGIQVSEVEAGRIRSTLALRSPIEGSVTRIFTVKGEYVAPESPVMEIVDREHIHLEINVFEKDVMKVNPGQRVRFTIPEASLDTFSAEVIQVGKSLNENRSVRVHADIDPTVRQDFLVGMFVNARIQTTAYSAVAVPRHALIREEERFYVYVLDGRSSGELRFRKRSVSTGRQLGHWIEWLDAGTRPDSLQILGNVQNIQGESGG